MTRIAYVLVVRENIAMSTPLWGLSACEMAEGIRHRRFSCTELMASVVERIRSQNPTLNAIVYDYTEQAMAAAQAQAADADLAAGPPSALQNRLPEAVAPGHP